MAKQPRQRREFVRHQTSSGSCGYVRTAEPSAENEKYYEQTQHVIENKEGQLEEPATI